MAHHASSFAADSLLPGEVGPGLKHFLSGTHRTIEPGETLVRIRPLMAAMEITRIADITGLDRIGIPVALAYRPNSKNLSVSQGKGISPEAAKASAVMETIELYHAETITLPLCFGSYEQLRSKYRLIEMDGLPFAAATTFTEQVPVHWIEGYDLIRRERVWLPYELVHTDFTPPFPEGSGYFQSNSNGLASGNELLEALSAAICEVVERDALSLWHLSNDDARDARRLRLDTVDDADCRKVLEQYRRAEIDVGIWDITSDIGIASFRCTIAECREDRLHVGYTAQGMGCHPCREVALLRALTEAAQSRLTYIAGSRDDVFRDMYTRLRDPDWARHRRRQLGPGDGLRDFRAVPNWNAPSFHEDVAWELERLRGSGIDRVVAVVLTKPQFGIPVVKVVVPGLEGYVFSGQYRPGVRAQRLQAVEV